MADELCHVAAVEPVARLNEAIAAVGAFENPLAGCGDHDLGIIRHDRHRVRVELDAFFYVLPGLSAVLAAHHPSLFDRAQDNHWLIRTKRKSLDMAHVGRAWEGPIDGFRQVSESFAVEPMIATVTTFKHGRWTRADKNLRRLWVLDDTPGFFIEDTVIDLPPGMAAILAALDAAAASGSVDAPRVVSIDQRWRSQCALTLKRKRTRVVLLAFALR